LNCPGGLGFVGGKPGTGGGGAEFQVFFERPKKGGGAGVFCYCLNPRAPGRKGGGGGFFFSWGGGPRGVGGGGGGGGPKNDPGGPWKKLGFFFWRGGGGQLNFFFSTKKVGGFCSISGPILTPPKGCFFFLAAGRGKKKGKLCFPKKNALAGWGGIIWPALQKKGPNFCPEDGGPPFFRGGGGPLAVDQGEGFFRQRALHCFILAGEFFFLTPPPKPRGGAHFFGRVKNQGRARGSGGFFFFFFGGPGGGPKNFLSSSFFSFFSFFLFRFFLFVLEKEKEGWGLFRGIPGTRGGRGGLCFLFFFFSKKNPGPMGAYGVAG